jgi:hypothetical protein
MAFYVVYGPPAAGKTTWVAERAKDGDLVIDIDALADAIDPAGPSHHHDWHVDVAARAALRGAVHAIFLMELTCDVYVITGYLDPGTEMAYRHGGAQIVVIDPGEDVVMERAKRERGQGSIDQIRRWYAAR